MIKCIITKGLQNSGKSFWSKQFVKENKNWKRVCRDDFRHMIASYEFSKENENLVKELVFTSINTLIENKYNIIIDEMNLSEKTLKRNMKIVQDISKHWDEEVEFEIKEFPITLGEALSRHKNTSKTFTENVIKSTWKRHEIELKSMLERSKITVDHITNLPSCVIVDIDGTLAYSKNRRIFDEENVDTDEIIDGTNFLMEILHQYTCTVNAFYIILMSGRQDSCREKTLDWLEKNGIYYDELYMRQAEDFRKDTIIKKELYEKHIKGKYNVKFVMDDRPSILDMWINEIGLFTLNVNQDPKCLNDF